MLYNSVSIRFSECGIEYQRTINQKLEQFSFNIQDELYYTRLYFAVK